MASFLLLSIFLFASVATILSHTPPRELIAFPAVSHRRHTSSPPCFPSLFSFGDSKADTGNDQAAFPFESRSEHLPYGRTYFGRPSDRYCDGRLVIDFQAQAYGLPLLSPYLRGVGADFRHGANFAASGSGTLPNLTTSPFYLERQMHQFKKLKIRYLQLQRSDPSVIPANLYFGGGLYVVSTGENDYRAGIVNLGLTAEQIKSQMVPRVIEAINSTLNGLLGEGARKFLVVGIAADGCISRLLTLLSSGPEDLDELGCVEAVNNYVRYHNALLQETVNELRREYPEAEIAYGDYYGINVELLRNAHVYGFNETKRACCGVGGPFNFNSNVQCGETGNVEGENVTARACEDPYLFINWDGIHLTEHFYEEVAKAFLHNRFISHPITLPPSCSLNFSTFPSYFTSSMRSLSRPISHMSSSRTNNR